MGAKGRNVGHSDENGGNAAETGGTWKRWEVRRAETGELEGISYR